MVDWSSVGAVWRGLEWRGALASLAMAAGWLLVILKLAWPRAGAGAGARREGLATLRASLLAAVLAAAAFAPSIVSVQVPLQVLVTRWMMATVATANLLVTSLPAIVLSGVVQEPVKAAAAWAGLALVARPDSPLWAARRAFVAGLAAGAGYGGFEAWAVLSPAVTGASGPVTVVAAALERVAVVAFHTALTGAVAWRWAGGGRRAGLVALAAAALVHGALNYGIVLVQAGYLSPAAMPVYVCAASAAATVAVIGWVRAVARRQAEGV